MTECTYATYIRSSWQNTSRTPWARSWKGTYMIYVQTLLICVYMHAVPIMYIYMLSVTECIYAIYIRSSWRNTSRTPWARSWKRRVHQRGASKAARGTESRPQWNPSFWRARKHLLRYVSHIYIATYCVYCFPPRIAQKKKIVKVCLGIADLCRHVLSVFSHELW